MHLYRFAIITLTESFCLHRAVCTLSSMRHPCSARLVSIALLLAADIVSSQVFVQDIPIAGIASVRALRDTPAELYDETINSSNSSSSSRSSSNSTATTTEEEIIEALEVDAQVTGEK